jgi:DNA-binding SARP family transcriptional activator/TolB-like protein
VTFGDPRLIDDDGRVLALPEKAIATLAFILTRREPRIPRLELAEFLWGDNDSVNALVNLRQLLSRIKTRQREFPSPIFAFSETEVRIFAEHIEHDRAILIDRQFDDPFAALNAFLAIMNGEYLASIELVSEKGRYWLEAERTRLLTRFSNFLQTATLAPGFESHHDLVREAAYRLLEFDAYSEVAYKALIKAFAADGAYSRAKQLFHQYRGRLWSDLNARPDQALLDFAEAVFRDSKASKVQISSRSGGNSDDTTRAFPTQAAITPRLLILPPGHLPGSLMESRVFGGLLEDVTLSLCRARSIAIVAPYTAQKLARTESDLNGAFERHKVSYVLETSASTKSERRLFATLSDCLEDRVIWAEAFDLDTAQLAAAYQSLIRRITRSIADRVELNELAKIATVSKPDAYQHYLIGKEHLKKIDLPDVRRARKSFRAALQLAPDFSGALSGLARADHFEWLLTARGDKELLASVETHALKAIIADADHPGGYHLLGVAKLYQSAFDESVDAFEGAELSAPTHADLVADYADALVHASQPQKALVKIEHAIELNPLCPDVYWWTAAGVNYCLERFETALDCIARMEDPNTSTRIAAACWGMLGEKKKALSLVRKTMEIYPDFEVEKWLAIMPVKENWQKEQYREGLLKAGFK